MGYIILILLLLYVGSWLYDVFSINNEPSNRETGHSVERAKDIPNHINGIYPGSDCGHKL